MKGAPWTFYVIAVILTLLPNVYPFPSSHADGIHSRSYLDVGISNVTFTGTLGDRFIPGDTVSIDVEVGHDNNPFQSERPVVSEDDLMIVIVLDDGMSNVTYIYNRVPSLPLTYTIARNETYAPYISRSIWNVSEDTPETDIAVTVSLVIMDDDGSDNVFTRSIHIAHIASQPMIWEEGQEEFKYETRTPHMVDVGDTSSIPFKLKNLGYEADIFRFETISVPEGWKIDLPGTCTVLPGDEEDLILMMQVPQYPMDALANTVYSVVLDVGSVLEPNRTFEFQTSHAFRFKVRPESEAIMSPYKSSVYLTPGGSYNVKFGLKNTGNFVDEYKLNILVDRVHLDNGWKFSIDPGTSQHSVYPGEIFQVIIRVTVPLDASKYYYVTLRINVTSMKTGYNTISAPCIIFADILYGGDIESIEGPITLEPGEENIVSFNFTNTGNDKDRTQNLIVTQNPQGWIAIIDSSPFSEGIGPMTTVNIDLHVIVPITYPATFEPEYPEIVLEARGGPTNMILDTETFLFSIPGRMGISIECEDNTTIGSPGEIVSMNITVTNLGNCNDTFSLAPEEPGIEIVHNLSGMVLEPGGTALIEVMLRIPDHRCADSDPSTPWPDDEGLYDPYIIHIDGWSQNETEPGVTKVSLPILMYILPVHAIKAEIMDGPIKKLPFDHSQARTFQVKVNNIGNVGCDVSSSILNAPSWLSIRSDPLYLPYDGEMTIQVPMDYKAFDMDNNDVKNVTIRFFIHRNLSEPLIHDLSMGFHFLPYSFHIVSLDISPVSSMEDERYLMEYGVNHTFGLLVQREGEDMLLPGSMDGPYLFLYYHDDGRFISRISIPLMEPGNETWIELGPVELLYTGAHTLEFRIEGMGADCLVGHSSMQIDVFVEGPPDRTDDSTLSNGVLVLMIAGLLLLVILIATALYLFSRGHASVGTAPNEE
ncbi:MAG: hypothetical protein JXA22_06715 [Candidatus Thermoplasmatota archaeon]|nr:hypothetical protein [Candidatus Thermoplasmatota archaeon]